MGRLFDRPPKGVIPISRGGDLVVDFLHKPAGVYTDYPYGVNVYLVIEAAAGDISATAAISGYHAVCRIQSSETDPVVPDTVWRCVVSYPTVPTTDIVAMNGTIARADS